MHLSLSGYHTAVNPYSHEALREHCGVGGGCSERREVATVRDYRPPRHAAGLGAEVQRWRHRADGRGESEPCDLSESCACAAVSVSVSVSVSVRIGVGSHRCRFRFRCRFALAATTRLPVEFSFTTNYYLRSTLLSVLASHTPDALRIHPSFVRGAHRRLARAELVVYIHLHLVGTRIFAR